MLSKQLRDNMYDTPIVSLSKTTFDHRTLNTIGNRLFNVYCLEYINFAY